MNSGVMGQGTECRAELLDKGRSEERSYGTRDGVKSRVRGQGTE